VTYKSMPKKCILGPQKTTGLKKTTAVKSSAALGNGVGVHGVGP